MVTTSYMPLAAILISLVAIIFIIALSKKPNLREAVTILAAIGKLAIILSMLPAVLDSRYPALNLIDLAPGIQFALKVDEAGMIFALLASALWLVTSFYSIGYMRKLDEKRQTRFYASFALCLSSTIGIAFSANLFTFYIFFEVLTIATYPLVTHEGTEEALKAGRKYLAYLLTGGVVLLAAIVYTYQITGTLDFQAGGILSTDTLPFQIAILFSLFVVGFGFKSAIMPLHSWLPSAMVAPTPVSALLHAVAVVKAGVFGMIRAVGFILGPETINSLGLSGILSIAAGITIIVASLLAFRQDNLKLRLAYSTIGHLSYIILGISLLSQAGWTGGVMHMFNHGVMKITLFLCAGAIFVAHRYTNISQLNGIGRKMPITMAAFTIASLGLAGIPPIAGFVSKFLIVQGTMDNEQFVYAAVILLSGLLNAGYFFPIIYRAFFKKPANGGGVKEAPYLMLIPIVVTGALSLLLGIFPNAIFNLYDLASSVAQLVMGGL